MPLPNKFPEGPRLVSPDELFEAARREMLNGKDPESPLDWAKIVNFFAFNIAEGLEEAATKLLKVIYSIPLSEEEVVKIARFQAERKRKRR